MKHLILVLLAAATVALAADSCVGRCGDNDGTSGCQCNEVCSDFGDCCSDYNTVCFSCEDRCSEDYVPTAPCQCNSECPDHGNCCSDFDSICDGGSTGSGPTDADIIALSEELFALNQASFVDDLITIDTSPPGPLFTSVDPAAFTGPTISAFMALRDNYDPYTTSAEEEDATELAEKTAFMDAVMATDVMIRTEEFMQQFSMLDKPLRDAIDEIFFTLYPRDGSTLGSSGFEHSFMGEIDNGSVKGFHNWISFYEEEAAGDLSYTDFLDEEEISPELEIFMMGFDWLGYSKSISSMWIGSTPEIELALYTVCFYHKPNALCDVSQNGVPYKIQTYTQSYNGGSYVGSAYPDIV